MADYSDITGRTATTGDLAVIGSNYGSGPTPGWVHNLEANPGAGVAYRDRRVAAMARRATDHETDQVFDAAAAIYAAAYGRDEEFYRFTRSLEAYRRSIKAGTTLVLTPDSEFLRYLKRSR